MTGEFQRQPRPGVLVPVAEPEPAPLAGKVLCDVREASCRCREPAGHYHWPDSPHRCDPECGGAWFGHGAHFEVVTMPRGVMVPRLAWHLDW